MNNKTTCSNGFDDLSVEIIRVSHDMPFEMFWDMYKETWHGLHGIRYDHNNEEHVKACIDVLNRRALPTPMEVLGFEVRITGLSRVALAQITRGRIGHCYNVQSQMPQPVKHAVTIPKNIFEHPMFSSRAQELQAAARSLYDDMYAAGIPPQDCRYMTLHGQQTTLMWHVNYGALLGWFSMRCENGLTDELNTVGRMVRNELINMFINMDDSFKHDDPSTWTDVDEGSGWVELIKKLDCMGADAKKCTNVDRVFGNTGRFPSAGKGIPSATNETNKCDYRFDRSAFYYELCDMDEELLFPGEKEMIDDWARIGFEGRLKKLES